MAPAEAVRSTPLEPVEQIKLGLLDRGLALSPDARTYIDFRNAGRPMTPADYASTSGIILALDDDPQVLRAGGRDLQARFEPDYRIARADSGAAALELLAEWRRRGAEPALFLVDQRMPVMTGLEFLEQASALYPEARRVLLTAYADTDAAISAINRVQGDHYLLKPWDPPEERLYPVLDELLDDWQVAHRPAADGIQVVGHPWTADSHRVKEFLARNHVPYAWMDVTASADARDLLATAGEPDPALPMLFFPDGTTLLC